jgi:putative GTP pyrophosphokinase
MGILFNQDEFIKLKDLLVLYNCALRTMATRLDILLEDFTNFQQNNPIEHITSRIKSPESIAYKLARLGHEITADSARTHLTDIAGLRCICCYTNDVAVIADALKRQPDISVIVEKDYISKPKPSGYRSYHLILDVPVFLINETVHLPVEIQIRTSAMDFWASLEHKVRYKYRNEMPRHLSIELNNCATQIANLDERMYKIHEIVGLLNENDE